MAQISSPHWVHHFLSHFCILIVAVALNTACDEDPQSQKPSSDERAQMKEQLESERTIRIHAEQSASAAERTCSTWFIGIGAGAVLVSIIAGLLGIHIGARGNSQARQESSHE